MPFPLPFPFALPQYCFFFAKNNNPGAAEDVEEKSRAELAALIGMGREGKSRAELAALIGMWFGFRNCVTLNSYDET